MTFPGVPLINVNITPEAIAGITTAMVGITQLLKWAGLDAKHAPLVLAGNSCGIVLIWVFMPSLYQIIIAASLVMMGASGVYGFATRATPPSPGATMVTSTTTDQPGGTSSAKIEVTTVDPVLPSEKVKE